MTTVLSPLNCDYSKSISLFSPWTYPENRFPIRAEVDKANQRQLNKLLGPVYRYYATDKAGTKSNGYPLTNEEAKKLLDRLVAPDEIALKVGTQVMLIKVSDFLKPSSSIRLPHDTPGSRISYRASW